MGALQPRAGAAQICLMQDRQASPCVSQKLTKNPGVLIAPPRPAGHQLQLLQPR